MTLNQLVDQTAEAFQKYINNPPTPPIQFPIPPNPLLGSPRLIQTVTVGGTTTTHSIAHVIDGAVDIASTKSINTPPLDTQTTLDQHVSSTITPEITDIALSLAFPLQPTITNNLPDGILISGTKEHSLTNSSTSPLGVHLAQTLSQSHQKKYRLTLANDAHCLVLAGISSSKSFNQAGLILGSGVNLGYVSSGQIYNLESGAFSQFTPSDTLKQIDQTSHNPGSHLFEKATSGIYLYQHYNHNFTDSSLHISSTKELSNIASQANHPNQQLAQDIIARSAALVSAQIIGLYRHLDQSQLNLIVEGSLFWSGHHYFQSVKDHLSQFGILENIHIFRQPQSQTLGAVQLFNSDIYYQLGSA